MPEPSPRPIRSPRDAEIAACDWLSYFGDREVRLGPGVADAGVDVESAESVVQVKAGDTPTGRPVVQQIFGIAALEKKIGMVFSVAPYTVEAVQWAARAGVALFNMDLSARVTSVNERAHRILEGAGGRLFGWPAVRAELEALAREGKAASITSLFQLPDGYRGYWAVWLDREGNVRVVRDFSGGTTRPVGSPAEAVEFLTDALRRLGGGFWDGRPVITVEGHERRFHPRPSYEVPLPAPPRERGRVTQSGKVRVRASDIYTLVAEPWCDRRLYLQARGVEGDPPSALQLLLIETGIEREEAHLAGLGRTTDLSEGSLPERAAATLAAVRAGADVIYQGVFVASVELDDCSADLAGVPDFLIRSDAGYVIRDTKTASHVQPDDRPDIAWQLRFYGMVYERLLGVPPVRLEVVAGDGTIVEIPPGDFGELMALVRRAASVMAAEAEPACLVKWSSRGSCPFFRRCWDEAIERADIVTVPGVNRGLARRLHAEGVADITSLLRRFDAEKLADVEFARGGRSLRVGSRADDILRAAQAISEGRPIQHGPLRLPEAPTVVLFDVEGVPGLGGSKGGVYLWGTKLSGLEEGPYEPVFAGAEPGGDRRGWEAFLERVAGIFDAQGPGIPFLHWANYERAQITDYLTRYGDANGVGVRLLDNLVDLLQVVREGITLPVRSYSLKVVEGYVGFRRSQTIYGGDWSITVWQEVLEASTPERRQELLAELATYNEEDLLGMWAVYQWLRSYG